MSVASDAAWSAAPVVAHGVGDKSLTDVNAPTVAAAIDDQSLRARLHEAHRSTMNERAIEGAARGEIVLPELGRVEVSARPSHNAVAVDVRAAHAETARTLYAQAPSMAAEVRAADIPVSSVAFHGAGTWTPSSDSHSSPRGEHRDADAPRASIDEAPSPKADNARARTPSRVRIVL